MELTQRYARPSSASLAADGLHMDVSAELSRAGVRLEALVKDSLAYARLMLALHEVVRGDFRSTPKDHSAYQEWVQQRYLEELDAERGARLRRVPALSERRGALKQQVAEMERQQRSLEARLNGGDFYKAKRRYFSYLWDNDREAWYVLDPVVSVHPDCVVFEVFSIDESSYGRVTVPMDKLETFGQTVFGTTNIDFSQRLADEFVRVRNYRPAWLEVGAEGVVIATGAGERVEKKIDLPPSWVRGFLQVQSASATPGIDVTLSAGTLAEVLSLLRRNREKDSPRSLRFRLAPGEKPMLVVDPWGTEIAEGQRAFDGTFRGEIRIWGRRRLFTLESLLPYADEAHVRLLGTGLPSYWTVTSKGHRFDLGLSGWTKNDWAQSARFDLLASTAAVTEADVSRAADALQERLRLSPEELAAQAGLGREVATAALQRLCKEGRAMFDPAIGAYRWRQLLPLPLTDFEGEEDQRLRLARRLVEENKVRWKEAADDEEENRTENTTRYAATVRGEKAFDVVLELDTDGRVRYAQCSCSFFRREKLRKGPCAHILAASALLSTQIVSGSAPVAGTRRPRPDLLVGKTFVFTGALTRFTRDEAESLVQQAGGTSAGSVSRNVTHLVAGEKAGSKLAKAQQLGIPVLTEDQFLQMLEG